MKDGAKVIISNIFQKLHIDKGMILITKNGKYLLIKPLGIGKNNIVFYSLELEGTLKGNFFAIKIQYNLEGKRVKRFLEKCLFFVNTNTHVQSNILMKDTISWKIKHIRS